MKKQVHSFFILTQGCKVNQYESQAIREAWVNRGMEETENQDSADVVLINSCAVTERAISDLKRHIRKIHEHNPQTDILVTGCAVQVMPEIRSLSGVTLAVPQDQKHLLTGYEGESGLIFNHPPTSCAFPNLFISGYKRSRGVVKIQDGCSHRCTYCIIPLTRGQSISRNPQDIQDEVGRLFRSGVYEVSLCGINLRHFGRDLSPKIDFWDLLMMLEKKFADQWCGKARIRLSSLEPSELTDKGLETLKSSSLVCPHLHVSLQSGCPAVLRRMGRGHYTPAMVAHFVRQLRSIWPIFALGADIITGFPGETREYFQETVRCVQSLPLTYAHIFPYSNRPGTAATIFPDQVERKERRDRAGILRTIVHHKKNAFLDTLTKQPVLHVIFENQIKGMNEFYVQCIRTDSDHDLPNLHTIQQVIPTGHSDMQLFVTSPKTIHPEQP
ncbi:MAG: MiaB/RimO family radical SAM methylthiotransferase [Desulfoplanes sp.]|jgi:MiaB/RimO family radical SAM methylthiotransferase